MAVEYASDKIGKHIAPSVTLSDRVKKLLEKSQELDLYLKNTYSVTAKPIHVAELAVYLGGDKIFYYNRANHTC